MNPQRITKQPDNTYRWVCRIDIGYHKEQTKSGYWAVALIVVFLILTGTVISALNRSWDTLWIPLLVSGVVLLIALPLLHMSSNAEAPMEEYWMTDSYVKAGYGKAAVFTHYEKVQALTVYPDHLELIEKGKPRRIYVLPEDIAFVESYIANQLPKTVPIQRLS